MKLLKDILVNTEPKGYVETVAQITRHVPLAKGVPGSARGESLFRHSRPYTARGPQDPRRAGMPEGLVAPPQGVAAIPSSYGGSGRVSHVPGNLPRQKGDPDPDRKFESEQTPHEVPRPGLRQSARLPQLRGPHGRRGCGRRPGGCVPRLQRRLARCGGTRAPWGD